MAPHYAAFMAAWGARVALADLGKSTYAARDPFAWRDFMENHFPTMRNVNEPNSTSDW
jgi:hypothetical protein